LKPPFPLGEGRERSEPGELIMPKFGVQSKKTVTSLECIPNFDGSELVGRKL